ncbi:MAG: sigma-E factor regulatory protein RseB domain-containing protein [Actinomycetota bacterium]
MTTSLTSRRLRWLAPAAVAALVAAAAFSSNVGSASGSPKLPPRTPVQLLAAVQESYPEGLSGTIVETAKLGLPNISGDIGGAAAPGASLSLQTLVTGSHTVRVWYAGETRQRVAVLGSLSESDLVHNGKELWTYTSSTHRVTHTKITQPLHVRDSAKAALGMTPQDLAQRTLDAIGPTTAIDVDDTARVAGRAAYQLLVKPKDARSLVGSVRIAIDAETSVPLRVQVFARDAAKPAIEVGFTDISFKVPDASVFNFVPPAGTNVVEEPLSATVLGRGRGFYEYRGRRGNGPVRIKTPDVPTAPEGDVTGTDSANEGQTVLGKGWTQVVVFPSGGLLNGSGGELLARMATPTPQGRILTSALVSVLFTDDGRVLIGSVTPDELVKVAATGRGL